MFDPTHDFIRIVRKSKLVEKCWPTKDGLHFSAVGHEIVAGLLRSYLMENPELLSRKKHEASVKQ
jgi:hypothetical protein